MTDEEICYECRGYGDDYYFDEHGDLVCYCSECAFNPYKESEGDRNGVCSL